MRFLLISLVFAIGAFFIFFAFSTETESPAVSPPETALLSMPAPGAPPEPEVKKPEATAEVINPAIQTGETIIVQMSSEPKSILFADKSIAPFPYQNVFRAIIPLPLGTKTGEYELTVEFSDSAKIARIISLSAKSQKIIILPPPPKLGLTDKQIVQNLATTNTSIRQTVAEVENITRFGEPFILPLAESDKISSPFGEVRQTGEESIVHLGTDFDAPKGADVLAINAGTVKEAYFSTIYGNTIIIDHGRGIYSLYMHLNSMEVRSGDVVKRGTIVGTVGETGLANAPHLHLSIKINSVSVDPIQFVSAFK